MDFSETPAPPDETISVRARPDQSVLIGQAADRTGRSRSEFVLDAACREAGDIVLDQAFFALNEHDYARFLALLDRPPAPSAGLRDLMAAQSPWE